MKVSKKALLISSFVLLGMATLFMGVGTAVAGYVRSQTIKDPENDANIALAGEGIRKKNYYLDIGIWAAAADASNFNYWVVLYPNPDTTKCVYINGSESGTNKYRYAFDANYYNKMQFLRIAKNVTSPVDGTYSDSYLIGHDGSKVTNASHTLDLHATLTTYKINSWQSSGTYSYLSSGEWY